MVANDTTGIEIPMSETFSDFREVDGVMVAFKSVSNNLAQGSIVATVKDVKFNVEAPDSLFVKPVK